MYEYIDDELDVGYQLLEYTFSDDEVKDTVAYAGDVVILMVTNDAEYDEEVSDPEVGDLDWVLTYKNDWEASDASEFIYAIGLQVPETAEPGEIYEPALTVVDADNDPYTFEAEIEVLAFNVLGFYLQLILVLAVIGVILYFLVF